MVAGGYRALALNGVHRRYQSEPLDDLAEPKSASVRLISCVHSSPELAEKPFMVRGSADEAQRAHQSGSLLPEVGGTMIGPPGCWYARFRYLHSARSRLC